MLVLSTLVTAQETAELPAVIDASDAATIEAAKKTTTTVKGRVIKAEWSKSGKVMTIEFENSTNFIATVFLKDREKIDTAFTGDLSAAINGAVIKITGKIEPYGGASEPLKQHSQMIFSDPTQLTVIELPPVK